MESATLTQRILKVLRSVLRSENIDQNAAFATTFEWDSLKHIEIVIGIEREFGVKVGAANIVRLNSVPAITYFLTRQGLGDVSK